MTVRFFYKWIWNYFTLKVVVSQIFFLIKIWMFHEQKGGGAHMGMGTNIYQTMGVQAGIEIFSHILFIAIAFYALQSVRLEVVFKKGKTFQIQLMYILLSIALGYTVSDFLIDFTGLSRQLPYIFSKYN